MGLRDKFENFKKKRVEKKVKIDNIFANQKQIYTSLCVDCKKGYKRLIPSLISKRLFEKKLDVFLKKVSECDECKDKFTFD